MKRYAILIEPTKTGFSAHVPDLPGCIAAAATFDEVRRLLRDAVRFHIEGLRRDGDPVPEPTTACDYVDV